MIQVVIPGFRVLTIFAAVSRRLLNTVAKPELDMSKQTCACHNVGTVNEFRHVRSPHCQRDKVSHSSRLNAKNERN